MNSQQETALKTIKDLTDSLPKDGQVAVLDHLLGKLSAADLGILSPDARQALLTMLPEPIACAIDGASHLQKQGLDPRAALILEAGGIFVGRDELLRLGQLIPNAQVPEIPARYCETFLSALHPLRGGTVASHVILAFDPKSNQWGCIDRGEGGRSDIVPGSLGRDGAGLRGFEQDNLIANVSVEGCRLESPTDSKLVGRILGSAVALHLKDGKSIEDAPFRGVWGRTADTKDAVWGCRIILGPSNKDGPDVMDDNYHSEDTHSDVGLLAIWS